MNKPNVLHIQRNFITCGLAEDLLKYIAHTQDRLNHVVLVHYRPGEEEKARNNIYIERLNALNVPVLFAQISHPEDAAAALVVKGALKSYTQKIDAVHTWMMDETDLGKKVADDNRAAFLPIIGTAHPLEIAPARLVKSVELSRKTLEKSPDPFICISPNIQSICINEYGFPKERSVLVPHGVDQTRFLHSLQTRKHMRHALEIPCDSKVVGMAARCDRYKDPKGFLLVAGQLLVKDPYMHFILSGQGMIASNPELTQAIQETEALLNIKFGKSLHLLGERSDMECVYNAMDIYLHTAVSEPFGLAPIEAKACGIQVAVTEGGSQLPISAGKTVVLGKGIVHPVRQSQWQLVKHLNGKGVPRPTIEETADYDRRWSKEFANKITQKLNRFEAMGVQEIAGFEERQDVYKRYAYEDTAKSYAQIVQRAIDNRTAMGTYTQSRFSRK